MGMVKGTANNGATPIYATHKAPAPTDQGDGNMGYDYGTYTTGYFSSPDENGDRDWIGNPTNTIIGYNDVFVADPPVADPPVADPPVADTTADLGTLGGVTSTPTTDTTSDLGVLGGVTSTPKGKPIYGTEPKPEQTDFGDDSYGYESSYTTGHFGSPDEYGDRVWIGNPTDEIIGYEPTADPAPTTGTDLGATTGTGTDPAPTTGTTTDIGALANISPRAQYVAPQSNIQNVYGTANMPEHSFFSYGV